MQQAYHLVFISTGKLMYDRKHKDAVINRLFLANLCHPNMENYRKEFTDYCQEKLDYYAVT